MGLNSFPLKERLKKNDAIKAVLDNGICYRAKSVNIYILKKTIGDGRDRPLLNRAAFICKKSLHQKKAVLRNRIRRMLREAYRKTKHVLPAGLDIVIVATRVNPVREPRSLMVCADGGSKPPASFSNGVNQATLSSGIERELQDVFKKYTGK